MKDLEQNQMTVDEKADNFFVEILTSVEDYCENKGLMYSNRNEWYYHKIAQYMLNDNTSTNFDFTKPLLILGRRAKGKTTPFKALLHKNEYLGEYVDFQYFQSPNEFNQRIELLRNFQTKLSDDNRAKFLKQGFSYSYMKSIDKIDGVTKEIKDYLYFLVFDNFGLQSTINSYGQDINVVETIISQLAELDFGYNYTNAGRNSVKPYRTNHKVILITGLTHEQLAENLKNNQHSERRFYSLFPNENIINLK